MSHKVGRNINLSALLKLAGDKHGLAHCIHIFCDQRERHGASSATACRILLFKQKKLRNSSFHV